MPSGWTTADYSSALEGSQGDHVRRRQSCKAHGLIRDRAAAGRSARASGQHRRIAAVCSRRKNAFARWPKRAAPVMRKPGRVSPPKWRRCTPDAARVVAAAFTVYFDLVNVAEEDYRVQALRQRQRDHYPQPIDDSIADAIEQLKQRGVTRRSTGRAAESTPHRTGAHRASHRSETPHDSVEVAARRPGPAAIGR